MNKRITSALLAALLCMPLATGAAALDWSTTETPNGIAASEGDILSRVSITDIKSHGFYEDDGISHHVYYCSAPCTVKVLVDANLSLGSSMAHAYIADDGKVFVGSSIAPTYEAPNDYTEEDEFYGYAEGTYWTLDEGVYYMSSVQGVSRIYIVVGSPENAELIRESEIGKLYISDYITRDAVTVYDDLEVFTYFTEPGTVLYSSSFRYGDTPYNIYRYGDESNTAPLSDGSYILHDECLYIVTDENGDIVLAFDTASSEDITPVPSVSFTDVPETEYYFEPVSWAVALGITNGTAPTTFSPMSNCTRGQIITFLWRAAGCPEPSSLDHFSDVDKSQYYAKAAAWAYENGIASGKTFSPDDACTRLAAVEFMWRFDGAYYGSPAASFSDVNSPAVNWALSCGITTGISKTQFAPDNTCTRGQIVTFLYRAFG